MRILFQLHSLHEDTQNEDIKPAVILCMLIPILALRQRSNKGVQLIGFLWDKDSIIYCQWDVNLRYSSNRSNELYAYTFPFYLVLSLFF